MEQWVKRKRKKILAFIPILQYSNTPVSFIERLKAPTPKFQI